MSNARSPCPPPDASEPYDVLELGVALIMARPVLERRLASLTADPDCSRRLLHATLRRAWRARERLTARQNLNGSLLAILRRQVLH